jgi:hypothetical protein
VGEDAPVIEREVAEHRREIDATLDALAYQANLKARLPEYADHLVSAIVSVALAQTARAASSAAERADVLASQAISAVKRSPSSVFLPGIAAAAALAQRLLKRFSR